MTKVQIRSDMKAFLGSLTPQVRHQRSLDACKLLAETKAFRQSQMIMIFLSMASEVETSTLAVTAWACGKTIAVPRVDWQRNRMEPVEITGLDTQMNTQQGVREPIEGKAVPLDMIDMVVIPGLAFDRRGFRVGRGRGFYDRFLGQADFRGIRCALCFHEQIIDKVPSEDHDAPMHLIVTDREVIHTHCAHHAPRPL